MRRFAAVFSVFFFVVGAAGFSSQTMSVGGSEGLCTDTVNSFNHSTQLENSTLVFEGLFCAPNTGYAVTDAGITVEESDVEVLLKIEVSDSPYAGMAVTPMKFSESEDLEPGEYTVRENISVDGLEIEEEEFEVVIEGDEETSQSLAAEIFSWFRNLF